MTHPITPPPELVQQWIDANRTWLRGIALEATEWGSDQELEACCEWLEDWVGNDSYAVPMRAARRPKPPSLKEQALQALSEAVKMADDVPPEGICSAQADIIRRALEQIDD
jgi:hypothetical protein